MSNDSGANARASREIQISPTNLLVQSKLFDESVPAAPPIRVNETVHLAEAPRLSNQCRLILDRLKLGNATNRDLSALSLKYTSRVSDLRAAGYDIKVIERNHETGLNVYALIADKISTNAHNPPSLSVSGSSDLPPIR